MADTIRIGFTEDMLKVLSSMKGKTLKSFECVAEEKTGIAKNRVFANIRINLGRSAVELYNRLIDIHFEDESVEEYSAFGCEAKRMNEEFVASANGEHVSFVRNERISEVLLVRDDITGSDYHEVCDRAVVIRTDNCVYTLSRHHFWDDSIYISSSDSIDGIPSPSEVCEQYEGDDGFRVSVNRTILFL